VARAASFLLPLGEGDPGRAQRQPKGAVQRLCAVGGGAARSIARAVGLD